MLTRAIRRSEDRRWWKKMMKDVFLFAIEWMGFVYRAHEPWYTIMNLQMYFIYGYTDR